MYICRKRARGGSISGRLRTLSDMEDKGFLDKTLKGVIKDKIIGGDKDLEAALDNFEKGDTSQIEAMIQRGEINRNDSIDFLDSLDFDFFKSDNINNLMGRSGSIGSDDGSMLNAIPFSSDANADTDPSQESVPYAMPSPPPPPLPSQSEFMFGKVGNSQETHGNSNLNANNNPMRRYSITETSRPRNSSIDSMMSFLGNNPSNGTILGRDRGFSGLGSFSLTDKEASSFMNNNFDQSSMPLSYTGTSASGNRNNKFANVFDDESESNYFNHYKNVVAPASNAKRFGDKPSKSKANTQGNRDANNFNMSSTAPVETKQPPLFETSFIPNRQENVAHDADIIINNTPVGAAGNQFIGIYSPEARKQRIERFLEKRSKRVWTKRVKYDVRKNFADSRIRVKGRFVKKEDEDLLRGLQGIDEL